MKKGRMTSEFWLIIAVAGLTLLNDLAGLGLDEDTLNRVALIIVTYIVGRSTVKVADVIKNGKK